MLEQGRRRFPSTFSTDLWMLHESIPARVLSLISAGSPGGWYPAPARNGKSDCMSSLPHLRALEAESIYIIREVAAEFERPVMLYSIGKDSSVMVRLAQKAFHPAPIPFPLLHIDTTYKFGEMIEFRDRFCASIGAKLIVHTNREAIDEGASPFKLGTQKCCGFLKTRALLDALA